MLDTIDLPTGKPKSREPDISNTLSTPIFFVEPEMLGSKTFKEDYGIKYAYLAGAMYKAIASEALVIAMGKAGLMAYLGTGGLKLAQIEQAIESIKHQLKPGQPYGVNLLHQGAQPETEMRTVELYIQHGVRYVEASGYNKITPALLRYRLRGLSRTANGITKATNHILFKAPRPDIAELLMRPAPQPMVDALLAANYISAEQAELAKTVPVAQDICVEADSGGHTQRGNTYVLMPTMRLLRDQIMAEQAYHPSHSIRVGAAGGIGTPDAAVAAFMLGADFVLTGSINQCTVEAGISDPVKDILQQLTVDDTDYVPAGIFENAPQVQVVKNGTTFSARANQLYDLYLCHNSIDELDNGIKQQIQNAYFKRSFDEVWSATKAYYNTTNTKALKEIEGNPKKKMAAIFRWYFFHTAQLALDGNREHQGDYQIHCGPALGAFNQWVKGTRLESWRNRHVAEIGELLMREAAQQLQSRVLSIAVPTAW